MHQPPGPAGKTSHTAEHGLPLGNLIEATDAALEQIDLERVVWDQEYRAQVRRLLSGDTFIRLEN